MHRARVTKYFRVSVVGGGVVKDKDWMPTWQT